MSNVYRADDFAPVKKTKPRRLVIEHDEFDDRPTLERAAANANLRLIAGFNKIKNPQDDDNPWMQPFWFVHELGEKTGVYIEARGTRTRDDSGRMLMHFDISPAREKMREFLINYYAVGKAMGRSVIDFGGIRGFRLKTVGEDWR